MVFLLLGFILSAGAMNADKLRFRHLTEENGLKNSHIHSVAQDNDGFIWIGTEYGLYRYDGTRLSHYVNYPGDTSSINSNVIFRIYSDSQHTLWIGTFMGLQYYDPGRDQFVDLNLAETIRDGLPVPVNAITEDSNGKLIVSTDFGIIEVDVSSRQMTYIASGTPEARFSGNRVTTYLIDRNGNHWIGTDRGVEFIRTGRKSSFIYDLRNYSEHEFTTTFIHKIFEDSHGNIWVLTREEGIFYKAYNSEKFVQFTYNENDRFSLGSNEVHDIYEDPDNQLWLSTNGGGLNLYLNRPGKFRRFRHDPTDKSSLLSNNIRNLLEDKQGNVWIVSFQSGMNIYINRPQIFRHISIETENTLDYQSTTVCSILKDSNGNIWLGTDGGGLKQYDPISNTFVTYLPDADIPGSFPGRVVMTIYKDIYGTFWLGTYQNGLVRYDRKNDRFISYTFNPDDPGSIQSNFVTSILEDRRGNFWIGTNGGGLHLFDRNSGRFINYRNKADDPHSLVDNFINCLIEDHNGDIWIATFWGLSRYNSKDFTFTNYLNRKSESQSLSHNSVFCLYEDPENRLWVGTRNGLNRYDFTADNFIYYTESEGLSGNSIAGITGDDQNNLWISTNNGLIRFNPETGQSVSFSEADGLQGNEFYRNSCYRAPDGEIFFGGINGLNAFYPGEVIPHKSTPNLVFTDFKILEQSVPVGEFYDGRKILRQSINTTREIDLKYSDKTFAFVLAAIDFISPRNTVIAYKLEGFDNDWNNTTAEYPILTYTNIAPGDYRLLVKAADINSIETTPVARTLNIHVSPPVYKTWWAYLIYVLTILFIVYYLWQLSISRIQAENLAEIEKLKREKSEELNQAKFRFFTNISHEFRTPLTLIIGPLEDLIRRENAVRPFKNQLDIMLVNARRMLRLINQLLDFRKIEFGKMALHAEYADLVKFTADVVHSFEQYAIEKQITFRLQTSLESHYLWFDPDKMDKILFNLLSNAFKFTPAKGSIEVSIESGRNMLDEKGGEKVFTQITVMDTGPGIQPDDVPKLFDRFYQARHSASQASGSGLGLSLTRNLVEIHYGKIFVDTAPGAGTTFRIYLPEGDKHLSEGEKQVSDQPGINKYIHLTPESYPAEKVSMERQPESHLLNKPNLLVVEDNIELMNYLEESCTEYFNFFGASNGKEGYEMATKILPDIIISDIMMPEMNGYQFCRKIKNHILTSHIPVILLTARTETEDQIEGFESGADAYIPKPFRTDQLITTANSILENRIRLREKFNSGQVLSSHPVKNTADDKFIQRVKDAVNKNLPDMEFGVLELSKELGISRVHLHRKLKAIANISPNEFIKNIRLQKAGELLLSEDLNISEVCFRVGFNSPAYFSSCFRQYYQMSPTEYLEKHT